MTLSFEPMEPKVIVSKKDLERHGLEEQIRQLAKVIQADFNLWVLLPATNLQQLTQTLEEKRISYGIESDYDYFRERSR